MFRQRLFVFHIFISVIWGIAIWGCDDSSGGGDDDSDSTVSGDTSSEEDTADTETGSEPDSATESDTGTGTEADIGDTSSEEDTEDTETGTEPETEDTESETEDTESETEDTGSETEDTESETEDTESETEDSESDSGTEPYEEFDHMICYSPVGGSEDVYWMDSLGVVSAAAAVDCPDVNGSCVETVDSAYCACVGNWDISDDCASCEGNWDISDSCNSCLAGWDVAESCDMCTGNYNEADDCATCDGNYDIADSCNTCIGNFFGTDCQECDSIWDATLGCEECAGNTYSDAGYCDGCLPYWYGDSCNCSWSGHHGSRFDGIWGASESDVFAVGEYGTIKYFNGASWAVMESGTPNHLYDVHGFAGDDVFAVGNYGTLIHYDGTNWTDLHTDIPDDFWALYDIWAPTRENIFICGDQGRVYHLNATNYSLTQMTVPAGAANITFRSLWGTGPDNVYAVGYDFSSQSTSYAMHYDGSEWTEISGVPSGGFMAIDGIDGDDMYVVTMMNGGILYHFDGSNWTPMGTDPNDSDNLRTVSAQSSSEVYVGSSSGSIYKWDGSLWSTETYDAAQEVWDFWKASETNIWAVTAGAGVAKSTGSGTWTSLLDPLKGDWFEDVWVNGVTGHAYAVGYAISGGEGKVYFFDGSQWTRMSTSGLPSLYGVFGLLRDAQGTADVYAVGYAAIYKLNGSAWESETLPGGLDSTYFFDVNGKSASNPHIVAVGGDLVGGNVVIAEKKGGVWSITKDDVNGSLRGVWTSYSVDVIAVGFDDSDNGVIYRQADGETAWTQDDDGTDNRLYGVTGMNDSNITAVGRYGTVLNWGGSSWTGQTVDVSYGSTLFEDVHRGHVAAGSIYLPMESGGQWVPGAKFYGSGKGINGTSLANIYMVGTGDMILHYSCQ